MCNNFIPFLREYFEKVADNKHKKFVSFKQMMRKEEKVNETSRMIIFVSWTGFKSTKPLTGLSYLNKLDNLRNETKHKNVNNTNNIIDNIIEDPSNDEENEKDSKNNTFYP